jgi:hypothetical protein
MDGKGGEGGGVIVRRAVLLPLSVGMGDAMRCDAMGWPWDGMMTMGINGQWANNGP